MNQQISSGEKYGKAMKVQTKEEAAAYFEECVQHCMSFGKTREEAEKIERINIGYWTGYENQETAERVMQLYGVVHPIFGAKRPTPEDAIRAGIEMGRKLHAESKPVRRIRVGEIS